MRTIDPFLAPGLWGGPPKPPQSPMMTAGWSFSPPGSPAVIARPSGNHRPVFHAPISCTPISHGPVASLAGSVLGPGFHAWYGRSGRRTICSVYPVLTCEEGKGLPDFTSAIVIAARREQGQLHSLAVFAFGEGEERHHYVDAAVAAGASEWHVHLLAENQSARHAVLRDLKSC